MRCSRKTLKLDNYDNCYNTATTNNNVIQVNSFILTLYITNGWSG
jgi:hypothetical protein